MSHDSVLDWSVPSLRGSRKLSASGRSIVNASIVEEPTCLPIGFIDTAPRWCLSKSNVFAGGGWSDYPNHLALPGGDLVARYASNGNVYPGKRVVIERRCHEPLVSW